MGFFSLLTYQIYSMQFGTSLILRNRLLINLRRAYNMTLNVMSSGCQLHPENIARTVVCYTTIPCFNLRRSIAAKCFWLIYKFIRQSDNRARARDISCSLISLFLLPCPSAELIRSFYFLRELNCGRKIGVDCGVRKKKMRKSYDRVELYRRISENSVGREGPETRILAINESIRWKS